MSLKEALGVILKRRRDELTAADALFLNALRTNPALYEVEKRLRDARLTQLKGEDTSATVEHLCAEKRRILNDMGISDAMLAPPPHCPKCGDTGRVDGKYCDCVAAAEVAASGQAFPYSFKDCSFAVFPAGERAAAEKAYAMLEVYCQKFPHTNKKIILLMGRCGTGKSFLASCVADAVSERGFAVLWLSAYQFVSRMLDVHLAPAAEKRELFEPYITVPLLVIDDLGSEKKLNNVSEEYLYQLLCEREAKNLHTLFTTNLDEELLASVYGERIVSRLFDKRRSFYCTVSSTDLRRN